MIYHQCFQLLKKDFSSDPEYFQWLLGKYIETTSSLLQTKAEPSHKGRGAPPPAYNHYLFFKKSLHYYGRIAYITKAGDSACTKIIFKEAWMSTKLNNSYLWDCKENKKDFCKLFISD